MNGTGNKACSSAETVPPVADIPTEPKAFQRWLNSQKWENWPVDLSQPVDLLRLAMRALLALQHRHDERFAEQWKTDFLFRRAAKADWSAFTTAYADHVGGR